MDDYGSKREEFKGKYLSGLDTVVSIALATLVSFLMFEISLPGPSGLFGKA
jgi:hypothetical protein